MLGSQARELGVVAVIKPHESFGMTDSDDSGRNSQGNLC